MTVGRRVRRALLDVVRDPINGLNVQLETIAEQYGIDPAPQFDWLAVPPQVYEGWVTHAQLLDAGDFTYPLLILFVQSSSDERTRKYHEFSGLVRIGGQVIQSLAENAPVADFEKYQDLVEDAFLAVLHHIDSQGAMAAVGAYSLRDTVCDRQPVEQGAENWLLATQFSMGFEVDQ